MEEFTEIYTDGSCLKNPGGPGGWAFVLEEQNIEWKVFGGSPKTTNNRMELTAVIESLEFTNSTNCMIYTDSQWVIKCATGVWKRKANLDLWSRYDNIAKKKLVKYVWVKGHSGNVKNELVDKLSRDEAIYVRNKYN